MVKAVKEAPTPAISRQRGREGEWLGNRFRLRFILTVVAIAVVASAGVASGIKFNCTLKIFQCPRTCEKPIRVVFGFESVIGMGVWFHNQGGMTALERLALIRTKAGRSRTGLIAKPNGLFAVATGQAVPRKRAGYVKPAAKKGYRSPFGLILPGPTEHTMDWIYAPVAGRVKREKGRHGVHWLNNVADKLKRDWHSR